MILFAYEDEEKFVQKIRKIRWRNLLILFSY
jgi:hypothetical protein